LEKRDVSAGNPAGRIGYPSDIANCVLFLTSGEKTALFSHFYIKTIFLPRQARDNHRESTPKKTVLSQEIGLRDDRSHKIAIATSALFQVITTMAVPAPPVLRI
jgi:hypothetical protein